jgi:hypothetical protein
VIHHFTALRSMAVEPCPLRPLATSAMAEHLINSATIGVPPLAWRAAYELRTLEEEWQATEPSRSPTLISILMY